MYDSDIVRLVLIEGLSDSDSIASTETDWEIGLAGLFQYPETLNSKKEAPGIIPAVFKDLPHNDLEKSVKGHVRIDANVDFVTMIFLDLDNRESMEKACELCADLEYFLFPTWSRMEKGEEKYRMVLRLDEPIPVELWESVIKKLISMVGADPMCANPSRLYFAPAKPKDPVVEYTLTHNKGKSIDLKFIEDADKMYQKRLKDENKIEKLKEHREWTSAEKTVNEVRHFTGETVNKQRRKPPVIDCSYRGMLGQYMHFVEQYLTKGHNHQFVEKVTMSDIGKYGEKADVESLVKFIYRVYEEFPNKHSGLVDRPGNTASEIARLIIGAAHKTGVEFSKVHPSYIPQFTESEIERIKRSCELKTRTHRQLKAKNMDVEDVWEFPGIVDRRIKRKDRTIKEAITELRNRYAEDIRQYMKDERWGEFAIAILSKEEVTKDLDNTIPLYETTQFLTYATDMLFRNHFKRKIPADKFEAAFRRVGRIMSEGDPKLMMKFEVGFKEGMLSMESLQPNQSMSLQP